MPIHPVYIGGDALPAFSKWLAERSCSRILVLTDHHTHRHCWPRLQGVFPDGIAPVHVFSIPPGEAHKTLATCESVWNFLTRKGFDRKSLMVNLGGGLVGDLGGFCAATFKRGIDFVQVPTSLLAQVDASVGGKTGINFQSFKNHLGAFADPQAVFADPGFFATLPPRELLSGYAEVLKHCLIADHQRWRELAGRERLPTEWEPVIRDSVGVKAAIVALDPLEKGPRKALNFGHTVGHGIETVFMGREDPREKVTHGEAVAAGMVCEAWLSQQAGLLTIADLEEISQVIGRLYPPIHLSETAMYSISKAAVQDKKNEAGTIRCTLLDGIGGYRTDQPVTRDAIVRSLSYYAQTATP